MNELDNVQGLLKQKPSTSKTDSAIAAQQLLQNGILVETNSGLICMSLNDALNEGVGGVSLSEEDFKNVAARLLSFEDDTDHLVVATAIRNDNNESQDSDCDMNIPVKPYQAVVHPQLNLIRSKPKITATSTEGISGPIILSKSLDTDEADSVLVSDSGLSSDTSEVVTLPSTFTSTAPPKRRGGWPKGRKRTPENKCEIRQPKAPATGYVIFLNERRKDYKDLRFTEVTKLLGNEWSRLSLQEKQPYLIQAEIEKKRYREELKTYRQSEAYRQYLQRKRGKRKCGHGTEESDMDATDEIDDDEDSEELYCRACDQWFHSLHNKKEHMYGKQHFANIAGRGKDDWPASTSLDESSLDGIREDNKEGKTSITGLASVEDEMMSVVAATLRREREIVALNEKLEEVERKKGFLLERLRELNKATNIKINMKQQEEKRQDMLEQRIVNLLKVTSLFR